MQKTKKLIVLDHNYLINYLILLYNINDLYVHNINYCGNYSIFIK